MLCWKFICIQSAQYAIKKSNILYYTNLINCHIQSLEKRRRGSNELCLYEFITVNSTSQIRSWDYCILSKLRINNPPYISRLMSKTPEKWFISFPVLDGNSSSSEPHSSRMLYFLLYARKQNRWTNGSFDCHYSQIFICGAENIKRAHAPKSKGSFSASVLYLAVLWAKCWLQHAHMPTGSMLRC